MTTAAPISACIAFIGRPGIVFHRGGKISTLIAAINKTVLAIVAQRGGNSPEFTR
jgi:hypothetical protein